MSLSICQSSKIGRRLPPETPGFSSLPIMAAAVFFLLKRVRFGEISFLVDNRDATRADKQLRDRVIDVMDDKWWQLGRRRLGCRQFFARSALVKTTSCLA